MTPQGFRLLYNRLDRKFEKMFDGVTYDFAPHETLMLKESEATWLRDRSVVKYDPFTGETTHALVMDGEADFEQPYTEPLGNELLSRATSDRYVLGDASVKTHVETVPVPGGGVTGPEERSRNTPFLKKERI
jgi:hypothetical protein